MKNIKLTSKKSRLEQRHKSSSHGKERNRIKAVLLHSEDWIVAMISQALRIHATMVNRQLNDFGFGKVKFENGGSDNNLADKQTAKLIAHLEEKT